MVSIELGDGVGIELAGDVLRGVRLSHDHSGVAAAAEIPVWAVDDDRSLLDAFVRVRAELGNPVIPTRIAIFPSGSSMFRVDVTGAKGPELNVRRAELLRDHGATSTVLLDDGPRRWMHVLLWGSPDLRRLEDLAERAGFVDVVVEPSPVALARTCSPLTTHAVRAATVGECFTVAFDGRMPVAAASVESIGRTPPSLVIGSNPFSAEMFEGLGDPTDIAQELAVVGAAQTPQEVDLRLGDVKYPRFPQHDLRSPERQCVALGACIGAAGLVGRLPPIDVIDAGTSTVEQPRPWAIERISTLPPVDVPAPPGAARRATSRLLPRRR